MWAAREGRSTIGIPKSVGEKFVGPGHDAPVIIRKPETVHGGTVHAQGAQVHPPRPRVHTTPPKPERTNPQRVKARMTPTARDRFDAAIARYAADKDADEHSDDTPNAAGIMFVSPEGKVLFTRRTKENYDHQGEWDFPGGRLEKGETSVQAARREAEEETSHDPEGELHEISRKPKEDEPGDYVTYVNYCESEFEPELDGEHDEFVWTPLDDHPEPLHPGVKYTLQTIDRDILAGDANVFALDYSSIRSYDTDGYLHVARTPISKANICPYMGSEIPDADELGLDPDQIYYLLRDPKELEAAAQTFQGKPLLIEHEPTSSEDHQADLTVGSVMNPVYEHPYLYAELVVWPSDAIEGIESGKQKQLSSGYRYRADMTPGVYAGANYDGIMRDIVGNHVAVVREGRAGADVVIGDSSEGLRMPATAQRTTAPRYSKQADRVIKALRAFLMADNRLTMDVRLPGDIFSGITKANYPQAKDGVFRRLKKELKGKLASDASLSDIHGLLDSLSPGKEEGKDNGGPEMSSAVPVTEGHMADPHPSAVDDPMHSMVREHLQGKLAPDDIEDLIGKLKGGKGEDENEFGAGSEKGAQTDKHGEDEDDEDKAEDDVTVAAGGMPASDPQFKAADEDPLPPFKGVPKVGKGAPAHDSKQKDQRMGKDAKPAKSPRVRKDAMDQAIADAVKRTEVATIARLNGIAEAKEFVRPWVGNITGAFDSADAVLRATLKARGIKDTDKLHADALRPILQNLPRASARPSLVATTIASDAKPEGVKSFREFIGLAS